MKIKFMLTLAFTALVAIAFAVPAVASANWTENGKEITGLQWSKDGAPLSGEAGSLTLSGPLRISSANGGIECTISAPVTLDGDSDSGQLTALTPSGCKTHGALAFLCHKVTGVTVGALPWSVSATESAGARKISIGGVAIAFNLEGVPGNYENGAYCNSQLNEVTVIGTLVGAPDNSAGISSLTPSGSVAWFGPKKEFLWNGGFSGEKSLSVSPASKYGITKKTRNVAISGGLGWKGENGGMSCTVNGNLALEAGNEGKVTSLNWSNCSLSGPFALSCGGKVNSVTSNSLPWTIVDQGSSIKISNFSVTVVTPGCGSETHSGEMVAGPNNKSAISSTSLSGTLLRNGWQPTPWSGSVNWTPAGVYGL